MDKFTSNQSLIRNRINENLLKVKNEAPEVKRLLSIGVQSSKIKYDKYGASCCRSVLGDMDNYARYTSRTDLLRTCILLATSRNTTAQENLIHVISIKLGKIREKDYKYIATLLCTKPTAIVDRVNDFLGYYLEGYTDLHNKYGSKYYEF